MPQDKKKTLRDIFGSGILEYFGEKSADGDTVSSIIREGNERSVRSSGNVQSGYIFSNKNQKEDGMYPSNEEEYLNQYVGELMNNGTAIDMQFSSEGKGRKQEDIMKALYGFVSPEQDTTYFSKESRVANPGDKRSTYNQLMTQDRSRVIASLLGLELGDESDEFPNMARGMEKINLQEGQTIGDLLRELNPGSYEDNFEPSFTRRRQRDITRPGLLSNAKKGRVR